MEANNLMTSIEFIKVLLQGRGYIEILLLESYVATLKGNKSVNVATVVVLLDTVLGLLQKMCCSTPVPHVF